MNTSKWWGMVVGLAAGLSVAGAAELSVDLTFSAADVELATAGEYTAIGLADGSRVVDEAGAPSIPAKFANILIPSGAQNVSVSASGAWTLLAEGITPVPAQPRSPKSKPRPAYVSANARYASATAWPAEIATYQGDHDMQGYRFVSVRVNPLAYVGVEKKLYLREKVTVTVSYDAPVAAKSILPKQASLFGPLVDSLVVNPEAKADFAPTVKTIVPRASLDYLIITSAALSNAFQQVADYRASSAGGGYTTRVLTTNTIGADYSGADLQAKIRACISNSVATLGTTMVLLGGDDTIVPVRGCKVSAAGDTELTMPTDLYYSGLGGSWNGDGDTTYGETTDSVDLAYDVIVGRLPVRTAANVTSYLGRVQIYETGWSVTNKIILGGPYAWDTYTGTDRPSDDVTIDGHAGFRSTSPAHNSVSDSEAWLRRLYRDGIRSYWPAQVSVMCDTLTSWDSTSCGDYSQSSANTASKFNQNYTHLMFSGHGAPQEWGLESGAFDTADATAQTGLTAFVYTDACLTGHFDKNSNNIDGYNYTTEPCLAEAFLRNSRPRGGALAYMGCARYGWGEPDEAPASNTANGGPSTVYAYKFYKRMYETTNRTIGLAFAMHKADMASLSGTDDCERWIQFGVNLLGDPALKMPKDVPALSAPSFTSASSFGATTGVARTHTVTASGSPTPVLALQSSTATAGSYSFVAATGILTYTPPTADVGTETFTFVATNTQGSATQTVSATVTLAPPQAPSSVWASATSTVSFTAAWSAPAAATGYRLDVATNSSFGGSGSGGSQILENIQSWTARTSYGAWTQTIPAGTVNMTACMVSPAASASGVGTVGRVQLQASTGILELPALDTVGTVTMNIAAGGAGRSVNLQRYNGSTWVDLTTWTGIGSTGAAFTHDLNSGDSGIQLRLASPSAAIYVHDISVTAMGGGTPSFVSGYSNLTVSGTSQAVSGLTPGATYYFRVRATNSGGTSANSSVANVTTLTALVAPTFNANPGPLATTAGVDVAFTIGASGSPAPALRLESTTAGAGSYVFEEATGDCIYVPPQADVGTRTFTFSASNGSGVVYQTVTVGVTSATGPAFTSASSFGATTTVERTFTVTASGTPAPTLALTGETVSGEFSFIPATGELIYTPINDDIGPQSFTFTAANAAGTVTQVVNVTVSDLPATLPVFGANPGPVSAVSGELVDFTVTVAGGYPAPTLALQGTTAGAGSYLFEEATGYCTYEPPETDVGTQTFTFTAANAAGTVTQIVSVSVAAGVPGAPASIWASATNATGFTAAWSSVLNATSYRLDVGTNATFSGGGASTQSVLASNPGMASTVTSDGWTAVAIAGTTYAQLLQATSEIVSPAFSTVGFTNLTVEITARTYGGTTAGSTNITVSISGDNGSTWTTIGVVAPAVNSMVALPPVTNTANLGNDQTRIRWQTLGAGGNKGVGVTNLVVKGWSAGGGPAYVAGYSNRTISGTGQAVTGLTTGVTYSFRVRAVNAAGTGANSDVASVTTAASGGGGTPPVVDPISRQLVLAGGSLDYTVTATATDGDSILSYACTSAVDTNTWDMDTGTGYFLFYPTVAEVGTAVFSFTAADKDGESPPVAMTVTVNSVAATNAFQEWVEEQWQDPGNTDFGPGEDADGDGMTTYQEYLADTDPDNAGDVLSLAGQYVIAPEAGEETGEIRFTFPASTGRYYQMEYCTDLTGEVIHTTNIGWGAPGSGGTMTVTNASTGAWYGVIRALLQAP